MKKIFLSAMILAAAVGCSKKNDVVTESAQGVEIRLGSSMEAAVQSKAAYSGDVAVKGLQFVRVDNDGSTGIPSDFTGAIPFTGDRAVGGAITFGSAQLYDDLGTNSYIASFFPAGALNNNTITWNIDGKTDVMTAATVDVGTKTTALPGQLTYKHQLAQIEVICKANAAGAAAQTRWGNINSIKVSNTPSSLSLDLSTMKVTTGATLGNLALTKPGYIEDFAPIAIPANTNNVANAAGMMAPMNSRTFNLEISTEKGGVKTVTVDLGEGKQIERAKKHVITLTFHPTQTGTPIVVTSAAIEEWTVGSTGAADLK